MTSCIKINSYFKTEKTQMSLCLGDGVDRVPISKVILTLYFVQKVYLKKVYMGISGLLWALGFCEVSKDTLRYTDRTEWVHTRWVISYMFLHHRYQ